MKLPRIDRWQSKRSFDMRIFILLVVKISTEGLIDAAKLRFWVGPSLFFEGQLPPIRGYHGFIQNDEDQKLYLFGGYGASGMRISNHACDIISFHTP
jgi:hypothetical protein